MGEQRRVAKGQHDLWRANRRLRLSYARAEVLSAFANSCYLLFLAFTECTDALNASLVRPCSCW